MGNTIPATPSPETMVIGRLLKRSVLPANIQDELIRMSEGCDRKHYSRVRAEIALENIHAANSTFEGLQ